MIYGALVVERDGGGLCGVLDGYVYAHSHYRHHHDYIKVNEGLDQVRKWTDMLKT